MALSGIDDLLLALVDAAIAPISFKAKRILFKPWLIGKGFCYGYQA